MFIPQRAIPLHSPSQPTPQRNADVGKTPYTHTFLCTYNTFISIHTHTHTFFMSHSDTQLVSQLTHSLLFWVVLEQVLSGRWPSVEIFPCGKMQPAVNAIPWLYKGESWFSALLVFFPRLVFRLKVRPLFLKGQ